jgi:hypothetical protein
VPLSSRFIKKSKLPVKYFFYLWDEIQKIAVSYFEHQWTKECTGSVASTKAKRNARWNGTSRIQKRFWKQLHQME